jgi:glutamate 5-kinase
LARGEAGVFARLAGELVAARSGDREIVLVSSGAIALGLAALGYSTRPRRIDALQAAAAAGQPELMRLWGAALGKHDVRVAQILLTHADLRSRERFLNARHAFSALLTAGVVPIVNENDTVATEEIKVGDNDQLSAQVASLVGADLLVLLTTVDGLFDADPEANPDANRIPWVSAAEAVLGLAGGAGESGLGVGGMRTKVLAAGAATSGGIDVCIADGGRAGVLADILAGRDVGTLFTRATPQPSRKHWIGYTLRPEGVLEVDAGAAKALGAGKKSLLPSGLVRVTGEFERGAMVEIRGPGGPVARGLAAYGAPELALLAGKKSSDIERLLGYDFGPEIVHRDDMVVLAGPAGGE